MAASESFELKTFDAFVKPLSSIFPVRREGDLSSETSDVCSDSGNETEENVRNVVRWLESLPNEENWCTTEEEAIQDNGTMGDAGFNTTDAEISAKKRTTANKYRRGTPRVSTDSRREKKKASSLSVVEKTNNPVARDVQVDSQKGEEQEAPKFLNEELARALDDSMAQTIRRYKRHETSWPWSMSRAISSSEPPTKRSKS